MNRFKLALASLAAMGAAVVAAPEPANAGGFSVSFGYGHPGYYGYGYRPVRYGWGYHRPYVRRVVVHRPWYPAYHYPRPIVRKVVVVKRYYAPRRVKYVRYGYPHHYRHVRHPHRYRFVSYGYPRYYKWRHRHW